MPIIIACGAKKLETEKPVQAKNLYTGSLFKAAWKKAVTLDKDVFILSAGYGLVKPNDLLVTYDIKMTNPIAAYLRRTLDPFDEDCTCILASMYRKAVPWAIPLTPILPMGKFLQAITRLPDGPFQYEERPDGEIKQLLTCHGPL